MRKANLAMLLLSLSSTGVSGPSHQDPARPQILVYQPSLPDGMPVPAAWTELVQAFGERQEHKSDIVLLAPLGNTAGEGGDLVIASLAFDGTEDIQMRLVVVEGAACLECVLPEDIEERERVARKFFAWCFWWDTREELLGSSGSLDVGNSRLTYTWSQAASAGVLKLPPTHR
jgi:hypothetical protein